MSETVVLLGRADRGGAKILGRLQAKADELGGGARFVFVDNEQAVDEIVAQCGNTPVLIALGFNHVEALAERLPKLQLVQSYTAGVDQLDLVRLAQLGVKVANNNGANAPAVAEHAIGLLMAVYHKLEQQFASVRAGVWRQKMDMAGGPYRTLVGKRVGIVGLGQIGGRVARRLAGWECEVVYCDTAVLAPDHVLSTGALPVDFDRLLQSSDVVSLHVPLNRLTRGLLGKRELGLMKPGAVLINTCRGPVVDEKALIRALEEGRLSGAGLDVTAPEPIEADNPLLKMANVVITPHLAAQAEGSGPNAERHAVENSLRVVRGEEPISVVKPV